MDMIDAGEARPWWRACWAYLVSLEEADYASTDTLMRRIKLLDGQVQDMRAELDAIKASSIAH